MPATKWLVSLTIAALAALVLTPQARGADDAQPSKPKPGATTVDQPSAKSPGKSAKSPRRKRTRPAGEVRPVPLGLFNVPVPADNPTTSEKVELGRMLYFDKRVSKDGTISCATCHDPKQGWAGHDATDTGINGRVGDRNSGTVVNSGYMSYQFWDGRAGSLEEQALGPIENPVEMGETMPNVLRKLEAVPAYRKQFQAVFGTGVTADGIAKAIAAFERTIVSGPGPLDRYLAGDKKAMSPAAVRGAELFKGKGGCAACHRGPVFSDQGFHNLGVGAKASTPDGGREAVTKSPGDRGRFKTPGLRNVARTYPYMHDGKTKTLADVVDYLDRGGTPNPSLDPLVRPLDLTARERRDLVAFLEALTGPEPKVAPPKLP
jgi:cytochrome c peroxidase